MKIFLSPSNQNGNPYAAGNTNEMEQCGRIAAACKAALEAAGMEVMLMHDYLMSEKVQAADAWGADLYIPIHSNAYNGTVGGTRIFYGSEGGKKICQAVFDRLAPLTPGTSENIRRNLELYEIAEPQAYSCYIEVDFHDVPEIAAWIVSHTEEIGRAIAAGICDYAGADLPVTAQIPADEEKSPLYRVQVGAFRKKSNAENLLHKLKQEGYDAFVVEVSA